MKRTQPQPRGWHIVLKDGRYSVYDPAGRFRLRFATQAAADAYIVQHTQPGKRQPAQRQPEVRHG